MKVYENRRGQIISYIRRAGNFLKIFHLLPAKQAVLSTSFPPCLDDQCCFFSERQNLKNKSVEASLP